MKRLHLSISPHVHSGRETKDIMFDVLLALLPATVAGVIIFGAMSLAVIAVCVGFSVLSEFIFNLIVKKKQTIGDLTAVITGLLLALNLPCNIPLWQAAIGAVFSIVVVKCLFGGLGCNLVNPAITGRVFMLVAFSALAQSADPVLPDAVTGPTPLVGLQNGTLSFENVWDLGPLFFGTTGGAIGETCAVALLAGFIFLLVRKVVTWHIPVTYVGTVFLISLFTTGFDLTASLAWILSGGLLLGAIFMATDYVTSPATPLGKIVFGVGAGLLTVLIRLFGVYPEGVSFAILLMNILNPYIERLTPRRLFGRK